MELLKILNAAVLRLICGEEHILLAACDLEFVVSKLLGNKKLEFWIDNKVITESCLFLLADTLQVATQLKNRKDDYTEPTPSRRRQRVVQCSVEGKIVDKEKFKIDRSGNKGQDLFWAISELIRKLKQSTPVRRNLISAHVKIKPQELKQMEQMR